MDYKHRLTQYKGYTSLFDPRGKHFISAFGVQQSEKLVIGSSNDGFTVYVTYDYVSAQSILRQLNIIKGNFMYLPFFDDVLLQKKSIVNNVEFARAKVLNSLSNLNGIVVTVDALTQLYPNKEEFYSNSFSLKVDDSFDLTLLPSIFTKNGYTRVDSVTTAGEFAIRGDIVDLFSPMYDLPVRISFFDDTIESIKFFGSDRVSTDKVDSVTVFPLNTRCDVDVIKTIQSIADKQKLDGNARSRINTIISEVNFDGGKWLLPYVNNSRLFEYFPDYTTIVWDEPKLITDKLTRIYGDHSLRISRLLTAGEILPQHCTQLIEFDNFFDSYKHIRQIALQQMPYTSFFNAEEIVSFKSTPLYSYRYEIDRLAIDVANWIRHGYDVLIYSGDEIVAERLADQLHSNGTSVAIATKNFKPSEGAIIPQDVEKGFVSHTNKLVVIGTRDLIHKAMQTKLSKTKEQAFLTPVIGEYVVHQLHGIGLCEGIQTIKGSWGVKDFIVVKYKNDDRLYVPIESSNLLSRFAGGDSKPTLSKIGGAEFERVKAKVKASIKEMSIDLLSLYATREKKRGHVYKIDTYLCNEFDASFEFVETPDQLKSINEIDNDLIHDKIMDRLLVGDVGYGKTEVALRTAFKVISNGYQAALMAPTTILAEQHYETAKKRMSTFNIRVECLNRFRTAKQQKEIINKLSRGEVDLLVGTHRLLGKDVRFNKIGLLILDEEQRFGVEHKEKLKDIKKNVDVLTLSATPIPRTLHMALTGMRDISTITTPPTERIPIETFVVEENDEMLRDIIIREISRGGQVFLVYNKVETIDLFAGRINKLVPEADIIVAHGQMDNALLEKSIYDFAKGIHNVLICTTIIENGIDIPNANTLIVYEADNLGLSQLYQLRGRVGRKDKQAYAYLMYKENKVLSEIAFKRLTSIMENTELGSGFKIAMADLEIRGAGNVLGAEQHGHMQKVGYEMYTKLLSEAMCEIKGEKVNTTFETNVDIDIDAYASDEYIENKEDRMTFYQKIANLSSDNEREELVSQLNDIYGKPPKEVINLLEIVSIKYLANKCGINNVVIMKGHAKLEFVTRDSLIREKVINAINSNNKYVSIDSKILAIDFTFGQSTNQEFLDKLKDFLRTISLD